MDKIIKNKNYLNVTYSEEIAPKGEYPLLLSKWLLKKVYKTPGQILDLGCGRGDYLDAFDSLGFNVRGADISPNVSELKSDFFVQKINFEKDTIPFNKDRFDYVFSKSVIEHMENPSNLLDIAYDGLKPGGTAVIMTPSWEYTYWGPFYIDHTHITPFTAASLKNLLEMVGFENVEVKYFYQLPFLWKYPIFKPLIKLFAKIPLPYRPFKKAPWPGGLNKTIRFSKEVMLLATATKPEKV